MEVAPTRWTLIESFEGKKIFQSISFCQGDSGGPLTVDEDGVHTLAGVTSHGLSEFPQIKVCVKEYFLSFQIRKPILKDVPDVYTRVSYFLPWINATILSNGGLASCDYSLTALPVQGDHDKPGSRWSEDCSSCKLKILQEVLESQLRGPWEWW